ncbi:sel1 repeat family protein [Salmonella enterica]
MRLPKCPAVRMARLRVKWRAEWREWLLILVVLCVLMMTGCTPGRKPPESASPSSLVRGPDYGHFLSGVVTQVNALAAEAAAGDAQARATYSQWLDGAGELTRAAALTEPEAARGNAQAQYQLGRLLLKKERPADDVRAAGWLTRAAEQGHVRACRELGLLYTQGRGVPPNAGLAFSWTEKAAKLGDPLAQNDLGAAYSRGNGVSKNAVKAAQWYRRAAEQGYALAQFNLGGAYLTGAGVRQNPGVAYAWYAAVYHHAEGTLKVSAGQMMKRAFVRAARNGRAEQASALAEQYSRQYGGGRK